jgi:hypothetical protein
MQKVPKVELLQEKKRLEQLNSFFEGEAGRDLKNTLLKRIKLGLRNLLDITNQDVPNFDRTFFIKSAQLKADITHYQDLTKVKSTLNIVMEALEEQGELD